MMNRSRVFSFYKYAPGKLLMRTEWQTLLQYFHCSISKVSFHSHVSFCQITFLILKKWKWVYAISMLSVCLSVNPTLLRTILYETWYVYHDTSAHLNGVLHKSLPSVCVSVCVSLLSLLGKSSVKLPLFHCYATAR
jgi:hypothetical protein